MIENTYSKPENAIDAISFVDSDGDRILVSRSGDGLVFNATAADDETVDVLFTPEDTDALVAWLVGQGLASPPAEALPARPAPGDKVRILRDRPWAAPYSAGDVTTVKGYDRDGDLMVASMADPRDYWFVQVADVEVVES